MLPNFGIPQSSSDYLAVFDNNNGGDFGFDEFNYWDSSNVADPSQAYSGVNVIVDSNTAYYHVPSTVPASLNLAYESYPNGGRSRRTFISIPVIQNLTLQFQDTPPHSIRVYPYPPRHDQWSFRTKFLTYP
jgi:hypothetical protein